MKHSLIFLHLLAASLLAQPDGGRALIEPARLAPKNLQVHGAKKSVQKSSHPAFAERLKIEVAKQPPNTWDAGVGAKTTAAVKKGDAILASFWARGQAVDGSGGGVTEFVFERAGNPYTKSVQYLVETPRDGTWRHYQVRFKSVEDYAAGGAKIAFQAGYLASTLELGGLKVVNFGPRPLRELPHTALTYVGREANAGWRAEAEQRIEQHRKGDLVVSVIGADGNPKPGVPVQVRMDRLDFDFGSAVKVNSLVGESEDDQRYRETFQKHFNLGVIENGLKWKPWDAWPGNRKKALRALDWLHDHNIPARGHVMVWPGHRYLPPQVVQLQQQPEALRKVIDDHIREMAAAAGDKVRDWDVLNEVYDNRDLTNALGNPEMVHWFKLAREAAPKARLYYNDYAGLVRGGFNTGHKDHFEKTLRYLVDNGAPLDGIGLQGHFGSLLTPPHRMLSELDRWAAIGPNLLITEFDVTVPDPALQADFTRDFLTVCFSHPKVDGVVSWGFWAGAQWRPESAFWNKDWTLTPMGKQWVELTGKWTTNEALKTNHDGQVRLRGYCGDYTVTAGKVERKLRLEKTGASIGMKVP